MRFGIVTQLWSWPGAFPRLFSALGWLLVAAWLYVYACLLVVNFLPANFPPRESLLTWMFEKTLAASFFSPFWVFAAIVLALFSAGLEKRPRASEATVFFLVLGLIVGYLVLGFFLD